MNSNPIISVIMPVFNAEKTVAESVGSVLNQSFSEFELIIINDGSTDGTEKIIKKFIDKRIRIITIENSGPSASRNKGIESANGDLISFLDSDDLWTKDKLEKQYSKLIREPECDVVYSWTIFIDENGRYIHPLKAVRYKGNVYEKMLVNNFVGSGSNILVKKSSLDAVGHFNVDLNYGEEWDLLIRLSRSYKFAVIEEYQIFYRQTPNSLSSSIEDLESDSLKVIDIAYKNAPPEFLKLKNKSIVYLNSYLSYLYLTRQTGNNWRSKSLSKAIKSVSFELSPVMNMKGFSNIALVVILYPLPEKFVKSVINFFLRLYGMILICTNKGFRSGM